MLGEFYSKGLEGRTSSKKVVERDSKKAFEYYLAAANQGYKPSFFCVADFYNNEYSSLYNLAAALEWYAKADCAEAYFKMCRIYEKEKYKDFKKAFECCQKAAALGNDLEYDYKLAMYYYEGKGTSRNSSLAIEHFLKCYKKHKNYDVRMQAAYFLGMIYKNGAGIERNDMEAFNYFQEAARYSYNVDALYELSKYVRRDPKQFHCIGDYDKSHGFAFVSCGVHHKTGEEMFKTCRDKGHLEARWEDYLQRYYNSNANHHHYNAVLIEMARENYLPAMEEMLKLYNNDNIDIAENELIDLYVRVKRQGGRIYLDDRIAARLEALL
jgi:TPR repeat protein